MGRKRYSEEFKERTVKECEEVGNIALVTCKLTLLRNLRDNVNPR
jgi:transposase-like protein